MAQALIIVTDASCTGKSTLAPLLARRFSCTLLDQDTIKEELFDLETPEPVHRARLEQRAREGLRHAVHFDAARSHAPERAGFLEIPGGRCRYDSASSSESPWETLFAALDALLQQAN